MRPFATRLQVRSAGTTYSAVVGVTVGMLVAGLAVPMALGRFDGSTTSAATNDLQTYGGQAAPSLGPAPAVAATTTSRSGAPNRVTGTGQASRPGTVAAPGTGGSTGAVGGPTAGVRLTASDQGVTASTVKLGVVLLDIRALEPLGFGQPHFTPAEQQQQYQFFIDQVNKSGGLLGRRIVPDYKTYNALDTSGSQSAQAICIALAENDKVFGAIGVLGGGMDSCLTEQYGIPAISNVAQIKEVYTKSHNLLVSLFPTLEREAANWGDLAFRHGVVTGHKTATVYVDSPTEGRPEQALVDALKADGQPVTYRAKLANDPATSQSQMPVEVQKMRTAGVDTVFLATNFVTAVQFAQTADKQGFRPRYVTSDIGALNAEGLLGSMPASFDGAYGFTAGAFMHPEDPEDKRCRDDFNQGTGNHYAAGNDSAGMSLFCWMVKAFSAGAKLAGTDLTRKGMALAFQHLTIRLGHTLPGSFGPNKTDYADYMRMTRYAESCKCYQNAGPAERGKY